MLNNDDDRIYTIGDNSARESQIFNILEDIAAEEQEKIDSCEFTTLAAWAGRTQNYIEEELARLQAIDPEVLKGETESPTPDALGEKIAACKVLLAIATMIRGHILQLRTIGG